MKFLKISTKQYYADEMDKLIDYDDIILPRRATKGSAGHDIFCVHDVTLYQGDTIKLPTGIKVELDPGYFLLIVPRSGLGFKYGLRLVNTCGVIDEDYIYSNNEGHIWVKLHFPECSSMPEKVTIKKGEALCQGIVLPYAYNPADEVTEVRNGGFGSTTK